MIVLVLSMVSRVCSGEGHASALPQPSSKATRCSGSKRPTALLKAPRPLRRVRSSVPIGLIWHLDRNISRTKLSAYTFLKREGRLAEPFGPGGSNHLGGEERRHSA